MRSRGAGSTHHRIALLWKFTLTTLCPRLQFIEAINPSVSVPPLTIALSPSALQDPAFNPCRSLTKFLSHSDVKLFVWF